MCNSHHYRHLNYNKYLNSLAKKGYLDRHQSYSKQHKVLLAYSDNLVNYREADVNDAQQQVVATHHIRHHPELNTQEIPWPVKKEAVVEGSLVLGGLMMVHEREDSVTCGPIMPQGGIQALEAMLYTLDRLNEPETRLLPNITLGAHILDDCDKDTYGLEMAVDFIKGKRYVNKTDAILLSYMFHFINDDRNTPSKEILQNHKIDEIIVPLALLK
ncbi:hypothetical protein FQA39_LY01239 [Lamprigera yunnana]|nr:hypothetical protein FQA39_LY01239 [Lamprigera yunnana]